MMRILLGSFVGSTFVISLMIAPARADDDVNPSIWNHNYFQLEATQDMPREVDVDKSVNTSPWEYRLVERRCSGDGRNFCVAYACANPDETGVLVERRLRGQRQGGWRSYTETCLAPGGPVVTPGDVLNAVRRIGLPSMTVQAPPETFVNYETVVYTKAETFTRTVNLLGFTVDIEATPSRFRWDYGDGATETTATAGRPYPATDITHTWTDAHRTFHPSVDVTYQIRYRVDGGAWQTLGDTITAQGPDSDVRIREATGMLANMH